MKGMKLNNQFEHIFSLYNLPQNSVNDLYLFLKSNLNNDKKASYSKYYNTYLSIKYSIIIEFSSLLLRKYVENDNKRIVSSIKKIYNFYNKLLYKIKQKYFYNLCAKIYSYKHKEEYSIHNKLFNDFKIKQKIINDLEKRIYQDEEEKYTFSPKINYNKNKNYNGNSKFEMKINNRRYSYSLKSPNTKFNINSNNNKKNKNILLNDKCSKTNALFYSNINSNRNNKDEKFHKQNNNIKELLKNNQNFINGIDNHLYLNLMYNKEINNIPKNDLINLKYFNKDNSYYEKDCNNKTSRNFYSIRKTKSANKNNSAIYLKGYDDALNNFEIIKNENKAIRNIIPKMKTSSAMLIEDENDGMSSYHNLKNNKNNNNPSLSNLYSNGKNYPQLLIKNGDTYYLIEKNNNKDYDNYDKFKIINRNESSEVKTKKKSMLNDLYNIKDNEKPINRNKRINSLQKNKLSSFNGIIPISTSSCKNKNKYKNIIYEPIKRNYKTIDSDREDHNNILYKKSNSLNSNNLYNEVSPFVLNINKDNCIYNEYKSLDNKYSKTNNNSEFNNGNKINNYVIKNKSNKILSKKEYYYTFRKGKIPYNSFNYLTNKKSKNKMIISKNKNPISLVDDQNKNCNYYSAYYNYNSSLARTNRIYLNNYNRKICGIKMENAINNNNNSFNAKKNNNNTKNYNKGSFCELTNKKEIISNNYTNYETKGCSFSSYSLYHTKSPKDNKSIKNTSAQENNNSINNSKSKNKSLSKQSTLSKKKLKKREKIDNIIKIPNKISEFTYEEKKNDNDNDSINKMKNKKYEVDSKVVNECCIHKRKNLALYDQKILMTGSSSRKNDKSMTLQSLSDTKMLELAEFYINNDEDSMDKMDYRMMKLKKNIKMERNYRDITFG